MGLGMSDTEFFVISMAPLVPIILVISVLVLAVVYFIRRPEIGPDLAHEEIKRAAILISILVPLALIIAFSLAMFFINTSNEDLLENILLAIAGLLIIIFIAFSVYRWRKFDAATKLELFQIPIKASELILFAGIGFVFIGIAHSVLFFVSDIPVQLILGLGQIILGLYFAAMWYLPTWHITEEGIYSTFGSIKWGMIVEQEWQPKNEKEVLFRCKVKRWWLPFKMPMTQVIPVEYEQQLKDTIQKYTNQETYTSSQDNQNSGLTGG